MNSSRNEPPWRPMEGNSWAACELHGDAPALHLDLIGLADLAPEIVEGRELHACLFSGWFRWARRPRAGRRG